MSRAFRAGKPTKMVGVRATDSERERWEASAILQRLSLSDMLRGQANATASRMERHALLGVWDAALNQARKKTQTSLQRDISRVLKTRHRNRR